jgi:hypothetical protein
MNKLAMVKEIRSLASGTMSRLFNCTMYEEIDIQTVNWVEWVEKQADNKKWMTWQDCWEEYLAN